MKQRSWAGMNNELNKNIDELAFKWSVDYKPWEEKPAPMTNREYAEYGYKQGYLQAIKDTKKLLMAIDNARTICPFTGDVLINFSEILRERNKLR